MHTSNENTDQLGQQLLVGQKLTERFSALSESHARISIVNKQMSNSKLVTAKRTGSGFDLYVDWNEFDAHRIDNLQNRVVPVLALLKQDACHVEQVTIDFGDGPSGPDASIVFCCKRSYSGALVPDYDFLSTRGYQALKRWAASNRMPWNARSDVVLWRGVTTGVPALRKEFGGHLPRVRMCLLARKIPHTDLKIVNIVQSDRSEADLLFLLEKGVFDPRRLPPASWGDRKFAIDIDGNTNSFGTLLHRQILGCCVLKVDSHDDWYQWFYDRLIPWIHYVPIQSDLSDLAEIIAWCRDHDDLCRRIAEQGRMFAETLAFDAECRSAIRQINTVFADHSVNLSEPPAED